MEKLLMEFIGRVMRTPELRKKFASCKNLKETYDQFKDELNGCSYETYKNFFKKAVATKSNFSVDELKNVSGGISLKTLLAPTALLAMFTAAPDLANFVGSDDISVGMVAHAAHPKTATTETEEDEVPAGGAAPEQQDDAEAEEVEVLDEGAAPEQQVDGNRLDDVLQPPPEKVRRVDSEAPLTVDGVNAQATMFGANTNPFREPVDNSVVTDFGGGQRQSRNRLDTLPDVSGEDDIHIIDDTNGFKILDLKADECGQGEARFVVGSECYMVPVEASARVILLGLRYWRGKSNNTVWVSTTPPAGSQGHYKLASCWDIATPGDGATTQARPYAMSLSTRLNNQVLSVDRDTLYAIRCKDGSVRAFVPQEDFLHVMLVNETGVWKLKRCRHDGKQWVLDDAALIDNVLTVSRGGRKLAK